MERGNLLNRIAVIALSKNRYNQLVLRVSQRCKQFSWGPEKSLSDAKKRAQGKQVT